MSGLVIGTPGGSLRDQHATFGSAATNAVGAAGEQRTAALLADIAQAGATVLHDLRIPGAQANIDHIVVSANQVWIIDSKVWAPGFYLTFRDRTWRTGQQGHWLSRFDAGDKRTLPLAVAMIDDYLHARGIRGYVRGSVMVVWPSSTRTPMHVWAYRPAGAVCTRGDRFLSTLRAVAHMPADPSVVQALAQLVIR